jgi:hypothetical protein
MYCIETRIPLVQDPLAQFGLQGKRFVQQVAAQIPGSNVIYNYITKISS